MVYPCVLFVFYRFFSVISSKCPSKRDEDSTSYSFISDSSVLSLHKLLWDHQEKIGTYLATKRWVVLCFVKIMIDVWCICYGKKHSFGKDVQYNSHQIQF